MYQEQKQQAVTFLLIYLKLSIYSSTALFDNYTFFDMMFFVFVYVCFFIGKHPEKAEDVWGVS